MPERIISQMELANRIGVSVRTVQRLHDLPKVRVSAGRVGYRETMVDAWIASRAALPAANIRGEAKS